MDITTFLELIKAFTPFAAIGTPIVLGAFPRIGPGRAIIFGLRSLFHRAEPVSQRLKEVEFLKQNIFKYPSHKEEFIVVRGQKGIGKTCAIDTAIQHKCGVVTLSAVSAGTTATEIVELACSRITRINFSFIKSENSARRVAFWFRLFFRRPPVVVISAAERKEDDKHADLGPAARRLSLLGIRVCIDCSDNAYSTKLTLREKFYDMPPMSNDIMMKFPEYEHLSQIIKDQEMLRVLLAICGGQPIILFDCYSHLQDKIQTDNDNIEIVIQGFIERCMSKAMIKRKQLILCYPKMKNVLAEFKEKSTILMDNAIDTFGGPLPDLKGVLRESLKFNDIMLIPSDGVMTILLYGGFEKPVLYDEIKSVVINSGRF